MPTIRDRIRTYLGLDRIESELRSITQDIHCIRKDTKNLPAYEQALGRILTKVDPMTKRYGPMTNPVEK